MKLKLKDSKSNKMILVVEENERVDIFNGKISGARVKNIRLIGGTDEIVDFNPDNGKFIVFEMAKDDVIVPNGDLLEIEFDVAYGKYEITIDNIVAVDQTATKIDVKGVAASMVALFSKEDFLATVDHILERSSEGIDVNKNGIVDVVDLQLINLNMEE